MCDDDERLARFKSQALADGYDEVVSRDWPADAVVAEHTHPFAVRAWLVAGEMWLTIDGQTRHLGIGDEFSLPAEATHAERYGWCGATYWVARRR